MTTITQEQIQALHDEADQAGDLLQAAICQIVLHDEPDTRTYVALSPEERYTLQQQYSKRNGWSKAAAIAECKRVIAGALAARDPECDGNKCSGEKVTEGCGACF